MSSRPAREPKAASRDRPRSGARTAPAGWHEIRQTGSHVHLNHADRPGVLVTVPVHAGQILPLGTLAAILSRAGLTGDELRQLL